MWVANSKAIRIRESSNLGANAIWYQYYCKVIGYYWTVVL
jgi:hypothetical protein